MPIIAIINFKSIIRIRTQKSRKGKFVIKGKKNIVKIYVSQPYEDELIIETRIPDKPYKTLFMKIKNKREKVIEFYNKFKEIIGCDNLYAL